MEEELLILDKRNDTERLKEFVQRLDIDKICPELEKICAKEDGAVTLQLLFKGLSHSAECQEKRTKVSMEVLNIIHKKFISSKLSSKLISVTAAEVESLSASQLIKLTNSCLQLMQNGKGGEGSCCWKELLPRLLNIIIEKDSVEHDGTMMTGSEFKSEVVSAMCVNELPNDAVVNVASMFIDMPLSQEEHLKVVNKLCRSIPKLKLDEIPPLVHQLLQLTKDNHSMPLFVTLADFFDSNLYGHMDADNEIPMSQFVPEDGLPLKELHVVEGTILYHVSNGLTSGPKSLKDFLKSLSSALHQPHFEQEVANIFKAAVLRSVAEEERVSESAWLESVVPAAFSVQSVLDKVIQNCFRDRDGILKGLVGVAFSLLEIVKTRGKDSQCESIWSLGSTLLVNLVQKYPQVTGTVFQNLVNQISQVHESTQYTDCLSKIASKRPVSLLECSPVIMQLLGNICVRLPGVVGQRVIAAVTPLTKMSTSLRDSLIIFLRKCLFSEKSSREMAVYGFLELLKDLKIKDVRSLSQSLSQNYVGITQIYSGTYNTAGAISNEGLCLEILSILTQVFDQEHQVKTVLYKEEVMSSRPHVQFELPPNEELNLTEVKLPGVYDCFYANPKLGTHILDALKSRLDKFHNEKGTPPLDFHAAVACQGPSVVVQESIPHLVLGAALIAAKAEDDFAGKCRFNETLDSICERMAESDIPHFGFEKEVTQNFGEELAEGELKRERIGQILGVYEALMGYVLCTWRKDSPESGRKLSSLFKGYSRLSDYARSLGKAEKKKADDNKKASQKDEARARDKAKSPPFKSPPTVLNFKCASRLLAVLNGATASWSSEESTELVKGKRELHRYALNVTLELIGQARLLSPSELRRSRHMLQHVSYIGRVLYLRCVSRLADVKGFDAQSAVLALECFSELLSLVCLHFKPKLSVFLTEMGVADSDLKLQLKTVIDEILNQLKEILSDDVEETESKEEAQTRKLHLHLISVASFLISQLPRGGPCLAQVLSKVRGICKETKVSSPSVAKSLLSLLLNVYMKLKASGGLLLEVVLCLCDSMPLIDDEMEVDSHEELAVVNRKTASSCLVSSCEAVHSMLSEVEWMVSRLRAELSILSLPSEEPMEVRRENLEERERELCRHLNVCVKILSTICTIAVPPGALADSVLKEVGNAYNKLVLVTKYFTLKVTKHGQALESTRFEKTIKLADHELSKNMYCFTEHIIANGAAGSDDPPLKKHKKEAAALRNKVLKETKLLPKVVYEKEQFQKFVLQLSLKAKTDVEMKHTMARDYRLYAKQVKEIIEKDNMYLEEVMSADGASQPESTQASKRARTQE